MEFRGNGAGFRELESAVAGATGAAVSLGGNLQGEAWHSAMRAAEVALVTLKSGAEGLVMPSKTYSAMVAGQALLAVCPASSDLADTVRKHDAGWVVEPGDTAGLLAALSQIAAQPDEVLRLRVNSFNAGHGAYDQDAIAGGWAALFDTIAAARVSHR
jgi:glycosyltransferase involved in cell wall biosynthesis